MVRSATCSLTSVPSLSDWLGLIQEGGFRAGHVTTVMIFAMGLRVHHSRFTTWKPEMVQLFDPRKFPEASGNVQSKIGTTVVPSSVTSWAKLH